ncbi:MAG: FliM/FliN family flagellar motor switch protein, partial [Pyrinomonadaceae bacterium]|nr:FliM/FliN family flagellar motor switch protein [Pyrinomonadaceae bacterium]
IDLREVGRDASRVESVGVPVVNSVLSVEPDGAFVAVECDANFAAALGDRMLGGVGAVPSAVRPLEMTELAVIEFLWLSVVSRINQYLGEPLFKLHRVTTADAADVVDVSNYVEDSEPRRELLVTVRLNVETTSGTVRLRLDENTLASFAQQKNPLLYSTARGSMQERMKRVLPDVTLAVCIGRTIAARADINNLEHGDVVVVRHTEVRWRKSGELGPSCRVRVGDGSNVMISGQLTQEIADDDRGEASGGDDDDAIDPRLLRLRVSTINGGYGPTSTERLSMENPSDVDNQQPGEEETAGGGGVLDSLMLTIHIELPARRIRLDELASLRTNQLLDLECLPTDPVELVADGRRLARGELVDIEGRLGVRITEVLT